jgi:hypothetical protein
MSRKRFSIADILEPPWSTDSEPIPTEIVEEGEKLTLIKHSRSFGKVHHLHSSAPTEDGS